MLEIDVFFGLDKQNKKLKKVLVSPDPVAAHSGDDIIWHFHSLDDRIKAVLVSFEGKKDTFFECRDHKKGPERKCHANLHGYDHQTKGGMHGHLLGTAPSLGHGVKASKYTITAYNGDPTKKGSKPVPGYKLDPTVVTCDP